MHMILLRDKNTGVAWLSSARAVRCLVKSFNERNSFFMLVDFHLTMDMTTRKILLVINWRKVRMTSSPYGPYGLGYTRATMIITICYTIKKFGVNPKKLSCSDCWLQLAYMKLESQVIVNHHVTVNLYLDLAHTARHMPGVGFV